MLDDRKTAILRAVVQEYITTAQPVGSGHVALRRASNVSSATVRNEMAVLEQEGYLVAAPHVGGPHPHRQGLPVLRRPPGPARPPRLRRTQQVRDFFDSAHGELEQMLQDTSRLLAGLTDYAAVVVAPAPRDGHRCARCSSCSLAARVVLLVDGAVQRRASSSTSSSSTTTRRRRPSTAATAHLGLNVLGSTRPLAVPAAAGERRRRRSTPCPTGAADAVGGVTAAGRRCRLRRRRGADGGGLRCRRLGPQGAADTRAAVRRRRPAARRTRPRPVRGHRHRARRRAAGRLLGRRGAVRGRGRAGRHDRRARAHPDELSAGAGRRRRRQRTASGAPVTRAKVAGRDGRLLRAARRVPERHGRRDQAGLPPAGARAASRRQPDDPQAEERFKEMARAYEVLSDPRAARRATTSSARPGCRPAPAGRAATPASAAAASVTCSTPSSAGPAARSAARRRPERAAAGPGPRGRSPTSVRGGRLRRDRCRSPCAPRCRCADCGGSGAGRRHAADRRARVRGHRPGPPGPPEHPRPDGHGRAVPACGGAGRGRRQPVPDCRGEGRAHRGADVQRRRPGRRRHRLDPAPDRSGRRRAPRGGRGRPVRPPAGRSRTSGSPRDGDDLVHRAADLVRPGRARRPPRTARPSTAPRRSSSRPARRPAGSCASAGRACPTSKGVGGATCSSCVGSTRPPS